MRIERLPDQTNKDFKMYEKLISQAEIAFSDPSQSGFYVRAAGITKNGDIVTGGNKENSLSDAFVHGETAVVSEIRNRYGKTPIKAIGFFTQSEDVNISSITPCGACRDVLIQQTSPDLLLMAGNKKNIEVTKLETFTFENFHPIDPKKINTIGINDASIALNQGVDAYLPEKLKRKVYGVSIVDQNGKNFRGSLYTNSGYDAITPGLAAVQTWMNTDVPNRTDINKIVIVSKGNIPSPFYRDRQALLELADITRLSSGRKTGVRVELIQLDKFNNIEKSAITDTDEWIPYPFSARSFGMDEAIESQYNKMFY
jgi:cytidine deaminase